jgi:hypothetical protein
MVPLVTTFSLAELGIAISIGVAVIGLLSALAKSVWAVAKEMAALKASIDLRFTALAVQIQENNANANIAFARLSAREDLHATKEWSRELVGDAIDRHCKDCIHSPEHSALDR